MSSPGDNIHNAKTREMARVGGELDPEQQALVLQSLAGTCLSPFRLFELVTELRGKRRVNWWLISLATVGMGTIAAAVLLASFGFKELALESVNPGNSFGATLLLAAICVGAFGFVLIELVTLVLVFRTQAGIGIEHVLRLNLQQPTEKKEEPKKGWLARLLDLLPGKHRRG